MLKFPMPTFRVVDPGPDEGKNDPQKIENKVNKFHFEVLDVLF
jgi:hypothetical protein